MIKTLLCCAPTFKKLGGLHQKMLSCVNGVTSLDFWGFLPTSQATLQQPHLEWDVTAVRNPACGPHLWTNQCTEPLYVTAIVTNTHTHTHLVEESYHTRLKTWGAWPCVYWSWWVAWHPESYAVNMGCGHFAVCGDACLSQWCVGLKPSNPADDTRLTSFRDTHRGWFLPSSTYYIMKWREKLEYMVMSSAFVTLGTKASMQNYARKRLAS